MKQLVRIGILLSLFLSEKKIYAQKDSLFLPAFDFLTSSNINNFNDSLNELRVTSASRTLKKLDDLPITMYVVTHEEIIRNQYFTLIDVLRTLPGVSVSQPGSGELGEGFQIRNLTGNLYTKILLDGLPIKPTVVKGMPIGGQLPIRQAERIEVIYGPAAAVYGADAVSGVINIVTKKADKGTFVRGDVSNAQNEYKYTNFMIAGKAGKNKKILQYSFYGNQTEFNNTNTSEVINQVYDPTQYLYNDDGLFNYQGVTFDRYGEGITSQTLAANNISESQFIRDNFGQNYTGTLNQPEMAEIPSASHMIGYNLKYRGFSVSYHNMYRRSHSSIGRSPLFFKYNNPHNYWGETIHRGTISYTKQFKKLISSTNLSTVTYRMDNNSSLGLTYLQNTEKVYVYSASDDLLFEQLITFYPIKYLEVVSGFSYLQSSNLPVTNYLENAFNPDDYQAFVTETDVSDPLFGSFGFNPINNFNQSVFMQAYYSRKKLSAMGGIRQDKNSRYGTSISPRFAIMYKLNERTSVRGSAGTAYKAPPSSMQYQSVAVVAGANNDMINYIFVPNLDLKPEKFTAYEYGINRRMFKKTYVNVNLFLYQNRDHIVDGKIPIDHSLYPLSIGDSVLTKTNLTNGISRVFGSQASIKIKNLIRVIKLDAELGLSYTDRNDELPNVTRIIKDNLRLHPKHIGNLQVSFYPAKKVYINVETMWNSKWLGILLPIDDVYNQFFDDVDGFYTVNMLTSFQISNNLSIYFKFINLFDEDYGNSIMSPVFMNDHLLYNPQLGRNSRFGLTYKLN